MSVEGSRSVRASSSKSTPAPVFSRPPLRSASISASASTSAKGKKRAIDTPISRSQTPTEVDARPMSKLPQRAIRTSSIKVLRRRRLERSWKSPGTAPITIVNDVDDEEVPPLPVNFRYLESNYL
ncbi:hypothetical protein DXG03_001957 [Asterophora parasitica]|uniref:Uncharacterized protein n=1 Tax=Asterophora parasitica TaxID=117018 RepID=A0A9P7GBM5_9AGAR|nr:hypothetical protein DXG03_001957 [Asterophora parasitica]